MKHIRNILLTLIISLISVSVAHSQNEKLWEFDDVGRNVYDLDFYSDTSFIYVGDINGSYDFIIRHLETTELIDSIHIERVNEFEIRDNEIICTGLKSIIIYDKYTFEQKSRFELPPYPYEDYDPSTTFIHKMDVSIDGAKICVIQEHIMFGFPPGDKILVFDLKTEEIQFEYNDKRLFRDVQFSPDGRYFTYSEDEWPAKVRFFDAQTYEHEFDLESTNDDDKDNILSSYTFSPTGKYVLIHFRSNNDRYINYDLELQKVDYIIPKENDSPFRQPVYYLTDEYYFSSPTFAITDGAMIVKKQGLDSIYYYSSEIGLSKLSYENSLILSWNNPSVITLARFDPELVSVETAHDTVEVYPQPSSGVFNISLNESYLNKEFRIYNTAGYIVSKGIINNIDSGSFQLNIPDIPKGVYYFVVGDFRCKIVRE